MMTHRVFPANVLHMVPRVKLGGHAVLQPWRVSSCRSFPGPFLLVMVFALFFEPIESSRFFEVWLLRSTHIFACTACMGYLNGMVSGPDVVCVNRESAMECEWFNAWQVLSRRFSGRRSRVGVHRRQERDGYPA